MYDVRVEQFPTVIREMIRHENEVTNHRIMWLLVGQGFIANAYFSARNASASTYFALSLVGVLVSLSAFVMLYQSYQARGYLQFLGQQAKEGALHEDYLPLVGWPRNRVKDWWKSVWASPWVGHPGDLLEPWLLLPYLFTSVWMTGLLLIWSTLNRASVLILAIPLSALILAVSCIVLVGLPSKADNGAEAGVRAARR